MTTIQHADTMVADYLTFRGFKELARDFLTAVDRDRDRTSQYSGGGIAAKIVEYALGGQSDDAVAMYTHAMHLVEPHAALSDDLGAVANDLRADFYRLVMVGLVNNNLRSELRRILDVVSRDTAISPLLTPFFTLPYTFTHATSNPEISVYFTSQFVTSFTAQLSNFLSASLDLIAPPPILSSRAQQLRTKQLESRIASLEAEIEAVRAQYREMAMKK